MNKLNKTKVPAAMLLAMSTLYGCGSGSDPDPTNVPPQAAVNTTTSADVVGTATKGTLRNASVTLSQLNGADISITSDDQTDATGAVNLAVQARDGFGINSAMTVTVTADGDTSMMCDAPSCAGVNMGEALSGAPLTGTQLKSLTFLSVPFGNSADSTADATFTANSLTTIATTLIQSAVAEGTNIGVLQLFDIARVEYSEITLKALGVFSPGANVFEMPLISAESYDNFVASQDCEMVQSTDDMGVPIVDANGDAVMEEVCTDVLADFDLIKLSLANAAFANIGEFEQFNAVFDETASRIQGAIGGDPFALDPIRERLLASVSAMPFLAELGITAEQVIDLELAFLDSNASSGPVQEITTDANVASAIITGRGRISAGEAEEFVFDGNDQTKWLDNVAIPTAEEPSWVQIQFAEAQAVNSLFITSANDAPGRDPENFNLAGSFDGENFVVLASFIGESFDERFERKEFRFSNGLKYPIYRFNIEKNKGDSNLMQIADIEFVGPIYTSVDHTDPVGTGVITARGRIGDGEAETKAFDNDADSKWLDNTAVPSAEDPAWVQVDFPAGVAVNVLGVTSANDAPGRDPENFNLVGSNDGGVTWVVLGEWIGEAFDERFERKLFSVDNILAFETYRLNITKDKGDSDLMQIAEIELIGPELPGLNHARTNGVVIDGRGRISDGEAEQFAFDGSDQTKWLDNTAIPTAEEPSFVTVEMVDSVAVNKLALTSANDGPERDPENFSIEGSNDGTIWIALGSWIGESFDERFQRKVLSFSNDLGFTQYRFNIEKNKGDSNLMQIAEIEMIGPQFVSIDHSSASDAVYSARASISAGEAEEFVFDDDTSTKWLDNAGVPSDAEPSWVQVDFTTAKIVSSISITSANDAPGRDPENFNLVGSNDGGVTWTVVASFIGESFDGRFERKLFEMGNGFAYTTYRFNITKNKGDSDLMQIAEIELIGPEL